MAIKTKFSELEQIVLNNLIAVSREHVTISNELYELINKHFVCDYNTLYNAFLVSAAIESAMWASDSIVDNSNISREKKIEYMKIIWGSLSTLPLLIKKEQYVSILQRLFDISKLHSYYEPMSVELAKQGKLRDAIYNIIEGKLLNAKIYIEVFKQFCGETPNNFYEQYLNYRSLILLHKDLQDFLSDLHNGDISVSTIIFTYYTRYSPNVQDIKHVIEDIGKLYYSHIKYPNIKNRALSILESLNSLVIPKFLEDLQYYSELRSQ